MKKLLVLGGTWLCCEIIRQARAMGIYVVVTDYLENSPGKALADKSFMVSTTDVAAVVKLIRDEKIDGVITGFIDWMLPYYQQICQKSGLPCYITKEQIEITRNKKTFKQLCRRFDVPVVQKYHLNYPLTSEELQTIKFPVIVKPVDNSGGRGITVCRNAEALIEGYEKALSFSPGKQVIVERYMTGEEASIFYIIKDGELYLSAMADRYTKNGQTGIIPLPVAYVFPSKHLTTYQDSLNARVIQMFKSIGIQNGMLFIQSFVENEKCIFYEMGFRLTASMEYKLISQMNDINVLRMMINFSLTGKMGEEDLDHYINPNYQRLGCNITFLARPGKVGRIVGVEEAASLPQVIDVVPTYAEGDVIPDSAEGTLRQVIIRAFAIAESREELAAVMDRVHSLIRVYSNEGENMLLETFDTQELFD